MSIMTKRGDDGSTDLMFGKRISKTSTRIATLGAIDELNAALGLARAAGSTGHHTETIDKVQNLLFGLMGELACQPGDEAKYHEKGYAALKQADLDWLTEVALAAEARGVRFNHWAVPGAECSMARAHLDFARAVSRRAERHLLMLHEESSVPRVIRIFLNRLSDLLWILARAETNQLG